MVTLRAGYAVFCTRTLRIKEQKGGRGSEKPSKENSIKNRLYSSSINRLVKVIANIQHDDYPPIHLTNASIQRIDPSSIVLVVFTMQIFVKTLTGKTITLEVER